MLAPPLSQTGQATNTIVVTLEELRGFIFSTCFSSKTPSLIHHLTRIAQDLSYHRKFQNNLGSDIEQALQFVGYL